MADKKNETRTLCGGINLDTYKPKGKDKPAPKKAGKKK